MPGNMGNISDGNYQDLKIIYNMSTNICIFKSYTEDGYREEISLFRCDRKSANASEYINL